ncbi:hypothetical protein [Salipiger sp. H15]|uniref:hypothetical protein n=1 Tax=Alloyangia sp. H15 TaxID=3029062 RepID=UPI003365157D
MDARNRGRCGRKRRISWQAPWRRIGRTGPGLPSPVRVRTDSAAEPGAPLATFLGQSLGWPETYLAMPGIGLLAFLAILRLVPVAPALFGIGMTLGNVLGGRIADRAPSRRIVPGFGAAAGVLPSGAGLLVFAIAFRLHRSA